MKVNNPLGSNLLLLYTIKRTFFFFDSVSVILLQHKAYALQIDSKACRFFMIHK